MKTLKLLLLSAATLVLPGCQNFLTENPVSLITPENFYQTEADANAAVVGAYEILGNANRTADYRKYYNFSTFILNDVSTEQMVALRADRFEVHTYTFSPANPHFEWVWQACYIGINRANELVDYIPRISTLTDERRARYVAEGKFLRALHYFNLVRWFGGVPLRTRATTQVQDDVQVPRASLEDVYAQVIKDLQEAEAVLPDQVPTSERGRATRWAAKTLLAKVFLTQKNWTAAAAKCKEVMDSGRHDLVPDYAELWKVANEGSREHIFSREAKANVAGSLYQPFFAPTGTPGTPDTGYGVFRILQAYFDAYTLSYRKSVTFATRYTSPAGQTFVFPYPACWKYFDETRLNFANAEDGDNNLPILRYADVLLMYAEALNETAATPPADAYAALNRIKARARGEGTARRTPLPADAAGLTKEAFREEVYKERSEELVGENHRWFDLVRWGRLLDAKRATAPAIKATNVLYPIPQREMDLNKALTQNPGY
jgi:hypothetical protein